MIYGCIFSAGKEKVKACEMEVLKINEPFEGSQH